LTSIPFGRRRRVSLKPGNILLVNETAATFTIQPRIPIRSFAGERFQLSSDSGAGRWISEVGRAAGAKGFSDGDHLRGAVAQQRQRVIPANS